MNRRSIAKQETPRICEECGASFYRKRISSGILESFTRFNKKKYCSMQCANIGIARKKLIPIEERFWALVDIKGPDECWPWLGSLSEKGYGKFMEVPRQSPVRAHRKAYELENGPIPTDMLICHSCDNPPCCNSNHLFVGTCKDNTQDMMIKGRNRHRFSSLTLETKHEKDCFSR